MTQTFFVEHIETPTGRMRIVSDDAHNLRALDWDDHEPRMQDLLRRHYGANAVQLRQAERAPRRRAVLTTAFFKYRVYAVCASPYTLYPAATSSFSWSTNAEWCQSLN